VSETREQVIAKLAIEMTVAQAVDDTGEAMMTVLNRYLDDAEKRGRDQERSVEPAPNYEGACCSLEQARSQYMKWQPNGVPQTFVDFVKSEARKIDPGVI
jgi:hypothetical protein